MVTHTEECSNRIFKAFARMQASTFDFLLLRYQRYPFKLIDLLLDPRTLTVTAEAEVAAVELLSAKACSLDAFALHVRTLYSTATALFTPECQVFLRVALQAVVGTTFTVETLHSVNLRRLQSRSMTHSLTVADVALTHAGSSAPSAASVFQPPPIKRERVPPPQPQDIHRKPPVQRRGGGGAWRAFLHLEAAKRRLKGPSAQQRSFQLNTRPCRQQSVIISRKLAQRLPRFTNWVELPFHPLPKGPYVRCNVNQIGWKECLIEHQAAAREQQALLQTLPQMQQVLELVASL